MKVEYVCIDFETANQYPTSACSLGLVGVNKDQVVFTKYYLINPEEGFLPQNILIHHITPDMVANEPKFYELWDEIKELIDDSVVVAHNAIFDVKVLKSLIDKYHLSYPRFRIADTLPLSRIAFPDLVNHKLNTISNHLEVEHNHHNAISDSYICYEIIKRCERMYQVYDIFDLYETVNLSLGFLDIKTLRSCQKKVKTTVKKVKNNFLDGYIFAFTGKPKTFTKTEFKKIVNDNGGLVSNSISLVINTFVIFDNPKKEHLYEVEKLQLKKPIKILKETDFIKLINDSRI